MKFSYRQLLPLTLVLSLHLLVACGKKSETEDQDEFAMQAQSVGNSLMQQLNKAPRAAVANVNGDLGPVLNYAFPKANSIMIPTSVARGAFSTSGTTPTGVNWFRQGNTYYNPAGQPINVIGGAAAGPYGGYARWGQGYNAANGSHLSAGLVYVPGYGFGVGVHGCSTVTLNCGTAVAGLGPYQGGYATCVNGSCTGARLY